MNDQVRANLQAEHMTAVHGVRGSRAELERRRAVHAANPTVLAQLDEVELALDTLHGKVIG